MIRAGTLLMLIITLSEACDKQPTSLTVKVASASGDLVVVSVRNDSPRDVVLLSPMTPNRIVDPGACTLKLSTKLDDIIRPFAFTPELVILRSGAEQRFRVLLDPAYLPKTCDTWSVTTEYAYVNSDEIAGFRSKPSEELRQHILRNQHVATATDLVARNE